MDDDADLVAICAVFTMGVALALLGLLHSGPWHLSLGLLAIVVLLPSGIAIAMLTFLVCRWRSARGGKGERRSAETRRELDAAACPDLTASATTAIGDIDLNNPVRPFAGPGSSNPRWGGA